MDYDNLTIEHNEIAKTSDGYFHNPRSGFNYSFIFAFERKFFMKKVLLEKKNYYTHNWSICFAYALAYVLTIYSVQRFMKNRDKLVCRRALIAWNFVLASFSLFGAIRVLPEFFYFVNKEGFEGSFCNSSWQFGVTGGWGGLFLGSKLPEFFDTGFIVARKQKLIFLHWYHHATVEKFILI